MKTLFYLCILFASLQASAQRPYGHVGAFPRDTSIIVAWADSCKVIRGYQNISNPALGLVSAGIEQNGTGAAGANGTVSLGDGGEATLKFRAYLRNGAGADFVVFENGFPVAGSDTSFFLELAFVEVSSDGERFVRFPSASLTDTVIQKTNADGIDPHHINNLAGRYMSTYGTPFDLDDVKDSAGLDVERITHVRLIDVIGKLDTAVCGRDASNRRINDPWPTEFPAGGFDLDAVGLIHVQPYDALYEPGIAASFVVYPNPVTAGQFLTVSGVDGVTISGFRLTDSVGKVWQEGIPGLNGEVDMTDVLPGIYYLSLIEKNVSVVKKMIIR